MEDILYDAGIFNPLISTEAAVDNALAGGSATSDGAQPETETGNSSSAVDGPIACVEVIISGMNGRRLNVGVHIVTRGRDAMAEVGLGN